MSSNRGRMVLVYGLIGLGLLTAAGGCSSSQTGSNAATGNHDDNILILGARPERGLAVQADRVAAGIISESGGPAIVIVPDDQ